MNNKVLVFSVILLTAAFGAVIHGNHDKNQVNSGEFLDLRLIGVADGTAYFYDNTTFRNWTVAREYCQSFGMQLAVINSQIQLDMLNRTYFPQNAYWTSGRDAEQARQFSWDRSNLTLPALLNNYYQPQYNYRSCVFFYKNVNTISLKSNICSSTITYTLCSS